MAGQWLAQGANANCLDDVRSGDTPLILAVLNNSPELVNLLLDHQADINFLNDRDQTPLILATQLKHGEAVECLLKRGANPSFQNSLGNAALHFVGDDIGIAEALLKHGAHLYQSNNAYKTPFEYSKKNSEMLKLFIDLKAIKIGDAAIFSALNNNAFIFRYTMEKGADINKPDNNGTTLFMKASWSNSIDVMAELIKNNANLDAVNNDGKNWLDLMPDRQKAEELLECLKNQVLLDNSIGKSDELHNGVAF